MTPRENDLEIERNYWKHRVINAERTAELAVASANHANRRADSIQGEHHNKLIEASNECYQLATLLDIAKLTIRRQRRQRRV